MWISVRSLDAFLFPVLSLFLAFLQLRRVSAENFTLGYLTGSQRLPGDYEYDRPGE